MPLGIAYLIIDLGFENENDPASNYEYTSVGVPDRSYLWIMSRHKPFYTDVAGTPEPIDDTRYPGDANKEAERLRREKQQAIVDKAVKRAEYLGYDISKLQRVPYVRARETV